MGIVDCIPVAPDYGSRQGWSHNRI